MKQPPTEPRPPMMTTMNTSTISSLPMPRRAALSRYSPHITPPRPASAGARHEHADEQPADAIAERLDHLAVLDAGADQKADPGAVENQQHARRRRPGRPTTAISR